MKERKPTMQDSLRVIAEAGVEVEVVLDVGVLTGTQPLIDVFPRVRHHLFEPVDLHFPVIEKNYRNLDYKLHHVALSDSVGTSYLALKSIHGTSQITHAQVTPRMVTADDVPGLVSCKEITRTTLDALMQDEGLTGGVLLKVDVDGHEIPILKGAQDVLTKAAVVVVEAPLNRTKMPAFFLRSNFLIERGFLLQDVVDLAYYDGVLWQADLVFVRADLAMEHDRLRPFEAPGFQFDPQRWFPLGEAAFAPPGDKPRE